MTEKTMEQKTLEQIEEALKDPVYRKYFMLIAENEQLKADLEVEREAHKTSNRSHGQKMKNLNASNKLLGDQILELQEGDSGVANSRLQAQIAMLQGMNEELDNRCKQYEITLQQYQQEAEAQNSTTE